MESNHKSPVAGEAGADSLTVTLAPPPVGSSFVQYVPFHVRTSPVATEAVVTSDRSLSRPTVLAVPGTNFVPLNLKDYIV